MLSRGHDAPADPFASLVPRLSMIHIATTDGAASPSAITTPTHGSPARGLSSLTLPTAVAGAGTPAGDAHGRGAVVHDRRHTTAPTPSAFRTPGDAVAGRGGGAEDAGDVDMAARDDAACGDPRATVVRARRAKSAQRRPSRAFATPSPTAHPATARDAVGGGGGSAAAAAAAGTTTNDPCQQTPHAAASMASDDVGAGGGMPARVRDQPQRRSRSCQSLSARRPRRRGSRSPAAPGFKMAAQRYGRYGTHFVTGASALDGGNDGGDGHGAAEGAGPGLGPGTDVAMPSFALHYAHATPPTAAGRRAARGLFSASFDAADGGASTPNEHRRHTRSRHARGSSAGRSAGRRSLLRVDSGTPTALEATPAQHPAASSLRADASALVMATPPSAAKATPIAALTRGSVSRGSRAAQLVARHSTGGMRRARLLASTPPTKAFPDALGPSSQRGFGSGEVRGQKLALSASSFGGLRRQDVGGWVGDAAEKPLDRTNRRLAEAGSDTGHHEVGLGCGYVLCGCVCGCVCARAGVVVGWLCPGDEWAPGFHAGFAVSATPCAAAAAATLAHHSSSLAVCTWGGCA